MNRFFMCLFVVFSLLLAPVVHAVGVSCLDVGCTLAEKTSKEKKQDDGELAGVGHCCCQYVADHAFLKIAAPFKMASTAFTLMDQTNLASITVGPLLEPPSHA